mgnify:FL=1
MTPPSKAKAAAADAVAAGRTIDLDAARAARAEVDTSPAPVIRLGGKDWQLPKELPADFAMLAAMGDLVGAMKALIGDEAFPEFWAIGLSMNDLETIADQAHVLYGLEPGKKAEPGES